MKIVIAAYLEYVWTISAQIYKRLISNHQNGPPVNKKRNEKSYINDSRTRKSLKQWTRGYQETNRNNRAYFSSFGFFSSPTFPQSTDYSQVIQKTTVETEKEVTCNENNPKIVSYGQQTGGKSKWGGSRQLDPYQQLWWKNRNPSQQQQKVVYNQIHINRVRSWHCSTNMVRIKRNRTSRVRDQIRLRYTWMRPETFIHINIVLIHFHFESRAMFCSAGNSLTWSCLRLSRLGGKL